MLTPGCHKQNSLHENCLLTKMEHSCAFVFFTTPQAPLLNGLFCQKSTDSGDRFGLIRANRVPEAEGGGG